MRKLKVGIIGSTGMVGQRFVSLLSGHPWFDIEVLAASRRSAGKRYADLIGDIWIQSERLPEYIGDMIVRDAADINGIAEAIDFAFCAVNMDKKEVRELENSFAMAECPIISNNSAHRLTPDVPMIVPELNASHAEVIEFQRKRLHTKRGFIAVKSNCSLQSYLPLLFPLRERWGLREAYVTTMQAVSGAGRRLETYPEIHDNVIPCIPGEEDKSEIEPRKILGHIENGEIVLSDSVAIHAKCTRVPISDGHMASVFALFDQKPSIEEVKQAWEGFGKLDLPSAPEQFIAIHDEADRPQTRLDRDAGNGMSISVGRLKYCSENCLSFVGLSHNTVRGAAGGAVLLAEQLVKEGYIEP